MQNQTDGVATLADADPGAITAAAIDGAQRSPVLDTTAALELMDGDMDTLLMILALIRDQLPEDRRVIVGAINAGDAPSLKKACHRLKGVVSQIGAVRAHAACASLEAAAAKADVGAFDKLHQELGSELDALSAAISAYLSEPPAASA